jgi:Fic family protein
MKTTGQVVNTALGTIDARTGSYRITPAYSNALGYYLSAEKIPEAVKNFCNIYNEKVQDINLVQALQNSFEAHAGLIMIHPWYDGNKRTSRLVMNYMQKICNLPLTKVDKSEMENYILSLKEYKENNNIKPLNTFMFSQYIKTLRDEIVLYKSQNNSNAMSCKASGKLATIQKEVKSNKKSPDHQIKNIKHNHP